MRTLAFDLDDTLYDESDYVLAGLATVAESFAPRWDVPVAQLQAFFEEYFLQQGREHIFDHALEALAVPVESATIDAMVACYRAQCPQLATYQGVSAVLDLLAKDFRLVLVTDGLPTMQRNKVEGLGIANHFEQIVYCWEHDAAKPDSTGYRLAIGEETLADAVIIGDHPINDGEPARQLGLPFIRVRSKRFAHLPGGDIQIDAVTQLPEVLAHV